LVMKPTDEERKRGETKNAEFFESLPENVLDGAPETSVKGTQLKTPLFEFSGACAGCGETPYVKLVTQMFGDRMIIANATGCSSIYGGTFPTIPYCTNKKGEGPAWANSLFEDNAEYGFGMRLAVESNRKQLLTNLKTLLNSQISTELKETIKKAIENLVNIYRSEDSPIEIVKAGNKYSMQLKQEYAEKAREVAKPEIPFDILKTLALIAYHQPIRQADLRKMIGPKVYDHVDFLIEKKLVNSKRLGTTELLTTSKYFPEYFGIDSTRPEEIREFLARRMGIKRGGEEKL